MKQIPLSGKHGVGKFALVDDEDYEFLMQWKWHVSSGYARRKTSQRTILAMHHAVLERAGIDRTGLHTDHANCNRLDNRRSNLRVASYAQNMRNRPGKQGRRNGRYKGVHEHNGKWRARISVDRRQIFVGSFDTEDDAARAYNEAALKYHGKFARLNDVPAVQLELPFAA